MLFSDIVSNENVAKSKIVPPIPVMTSRHCNFKIRIYISNKLPKIYGKILLFAAFSLETICQKTASKF